MLIAEEEFSEIEGSVQYCDMLGGDSPLVDWDAIVAVWKY